MTLDALDPSVILDGIWALYLADTGGFKSALYTDANNPGLYLYTAPQGTNFPFATYGFSDIDQDYSFSEENVVAEVYFDIWTETGQSAANVLIGDLFELFDNAVISVTGWRALHMIRSAPALPINEIDRDPPLYRWNAAYEIFLERTR